jgi:hypothetical protein
VNSYFYLCKCGYHHHCVDVDALVGGTTDVIEDPVALHLGYNDRGSSHSVVCVSDLDSPPFCTDILYMACVACDTYFV